MNIDKQNRTNSVFIIAEAGVNHNGSVKMAKELIDIAADAGTDAVKFQTFKADNVISRHAPKTVYQKKTTNETESQLDMVKKLELNESAHSLLIEHCHNRNIQFLSAPFDFSSVDLLAHKLNLPLIKIPSGEITNGPYLLHIAKTGKPVILSTGMSTLGEIETALGILAFGYLSIKEGPSLRKFHDAYCSEGGRQIIAEKVILLHCTTEYPAEFEEVNLRAMDTMRTAFSLPVVVSDHTPGIAVPIAAVALGAAVIEKHFTLDRSLPGPDHKASIEPDELKAMVIAIRQVEKALGNGQKVPALSELKNRDIVRKSLVAAKPIYKTDVFSQENLLMKRPGTGISPLYYWGLLERISDKDYLKDELITE